MTERWAADRAGCILDGAVRTGDELNAAVLRLARTEGWLDEYEVSDQVTGWLDNLDASEFLSEAANEAVDWLNEHIAPEGFVFEFDAGLYLWNAEEDDD